jgi:hypothetical protein
MGNESMNVPMYAGRKGPWADEGKAETLNMDNWGSQLCSNVGPPTLEWLRRGYLFSARATAAQALIIFSTATNAPTLWNPAGSNKLVIPLYINFHPVAVASAVHTGILLGLKTGCGSAAATGAPFPTFTNKAPNCLTPAAGKTSTTLYSDAVVTFTAIPTVFVDVGAHQLAAGSPMPPRIDISGLVALGPGDAMTIMGQAASVNTYWMSVIFAELPFGFSLS